MLSLVSRHNPPRMREASIIANRALALGIVSLVPRLHPLRKHRKARGAGHSLVPSRPMPTAFRVGVREGSGVWAMETRLRWAMTALQVCLLLALVAATCTLGDAVASCDQTDVKNTLRQSACRLRANRTEGEEFRASVRAKHGLPDCELLRILFLHKKVLFTPSPYSEQFR